MLKKLCVHISVFRTGGLPRRYSNAKSSHSGMEYEKLKKERSATIRNRNAKSIDRGRPLTTTSVFFTREINVKFSYFYFSYGFLLVYTVLALL